VKKHLKNNGTNNQPMEQTEETSYLEKNRNNKKKSAKKQFKHQQKLTRNDHRYN
jgi:hypothetical protein